MKPSAAACMVLLLVLCHDALSQNFFSQHFSSPTVVNPANTGNFYGDYRLGGLCRSEKEGLPQSVSKASFFGDTRLLQTTLPENDKLAIGLGAIAERNRFYGIKNSYLLLSVAYHKALDQDASQQLSLGFQVAFSHQSIESQSLIMEDQLRHLIATGFSGISPDQNAAININYPDLSVGLRYKYTIRENDVLTAGFSVYHSNRPFRTYNGGQFKLSPQACGQLGWEHIIDDRRKLISTIILSDNNATNAGDLFIGCMYDMKINEGNYNLGLGGVYRKSQFKGPALLPCVSLHYNRFTLNVSYDIDLSRKTASQRGAFEVGLVYIGAKRSKK